MIVKSSRTFVPHLEDVAAVEDVPPGLLVCSPRAGPRVAAAVVHKHVPVVLVRNTDNLCWSSSSFSTLGQSHLPGVDSSAKQRVLRINLDIGDILRSAELGGGRQAAVITTLNIRRHYRKTVPCPALVPSPVWSHTCRPPAA